MATELEEAAGVKISTLCYHGNRTGRSCRSEDQYTLLPWQRNWKIFQSRQSSVSSATHSLLLLFSGDECPLYAIFTNQNS
ncbi:hypothetical protein RRG08_023878 [Elysia crispata]|uniref:Uncharacterized protein n=1 Tax=Elysia crispata TaxID=231223 RepID=A0AAE1E4C4_9GAST|nr:hypothetical protein RRG08_023878 [Elysia crispata]